MFRKKEGKREEMYKTNLLSQCLYCNACIILLVVGSIAFRKVDLRRTDEERSGPTCDQCPAKRFGKTLNKGTKGKQQHENVLRKF